MVVRPGRRAVVTGHAAEPEEFAYAHSAHENRKRHRILLVGRALQVPSRWADDPPSASSILQNPCCTKDSHIIRPNNNQVMSTTTSAAKRPALFRHVVGQCTPQMNDTTATTAPRP